MTKSRYVSREFQEMCVKEFPTLIVSQYQVQANMVLRSQSVSRDGCIRTYYLHSCPIPGAGRQGTYHLVDRCKWHFHPAKDDLVIACIYYQMSPRCDIFRPLSDSFKVSADVLRSKGTAADARMRWTDYNKLNRPAVYKFLWMRKHPSKSGPLIRSISGFRTAPFPSFLFPLSPSPVLFSPRFPLSLSKHLFGSL